MVSVELDTVLTVAIGRNLADGTPMDDERWSLFQWSVRHLLDAHGTVVCHALSVAAVGSDGVNDGAEEDSAVFIVVNPADEQLLRRRLGDELTGFGQTSACFSVDHFHEPVFAGTTDGYRPRVGPDPELERWLQDGQARRTQSRND